MSRFKPGIAKSDFFSHLMFWTKCDLGDLLKMYVTSSIALVFLRKGGKCYFMHWDERALYPPIWKHFCISPKLSKKDSCPYDFNIVLL